MLHQKQQNSVKWIQASAIVAFTAMILACASSQGTTYTRPAAGDCAQAEMPDSCRMQNSDITYAYEPATAE